MSKISHHNIEEWLFNFAEGNLSNAETNELKSFIQAHPQYAEELEFWQQTKIQENIPEFNNNSLHELADTHVKGVKRTIALLSLLFFLGIVSFWYLFIGYNNTNNALLNNTTIKNNPDDNSSIGISSVNNNFSNQNYSDPWSAEINNSKSSPSEKYTGDSENNVYTGNFASKLPHNTSLSINNIKETISNDYTNKSPSSTDNIKDESERIIFVPKENNSLDNNFVSVKIELDKPEKVKYKNNTYEGFKKEYLKPDPNYIAFKREPAKIELSEQRKTNNKKFFDYELGFHNNRNIYLLHIENNLLNEYAAAAGTMGTGNLHLNYLNRFTGSSQNAASYLAGIDFYSKKLKSGFALISRYNEIGNGKINNLNLNLLYSYKIKINRFNSIETGLGIGYNQTNTAGITNNPIVEITPANMYILPENSIAEFRKLNLSASALYHSKHFYLMAGSDFIFLKNELQINNYTVYEGHLPAKLKAVIGTDFKRYFDNPWSISPQMSFIHRGNQSEFWIGAIYRYSGIGGGVSLANNNQIMGTLNLMYNKFSFGYNINYGKSYFNNQYYFTHEASLRMAFNALEKKKVAILDSEK